MIAALRRGAWLWTTLALVFAGSSPTDGYARLSLHALYGQRQIRQIAVSPSGELLASIRTERGWDLVVVQARGGGARRVVLKRLGGVLQLRWIGDRHLLVKTGRALFMASSHVVRVRTKDGALDSETQPIRAVGEFVSLLPDAGGEVLWAVEERTHGAVYRVPVERLQKKADGATLASEGHPQVARLRGRASSWVADGRGVVRAAVLRGPAKTAEIWYRESADRAWRMLLDYDASEDTVLPLAVASNGRDLIVRSDRDRDTIALVELSIDPPKLGRVLFEHPDADVIGVVRDYKGVEVIGAIYEREGLPEYHFFESFADRYHRSLERAFPDRVVTIISGSRDRSILVVETQSPRDPGTYYVVDTTRNEAVHAGRAMPQIDPDDLSPVEAIRVDAVDGTELDVFVARPRQPRDRAGKPPLVVLPHGGPVGVRDTRAFDPLVQYLADGGLAVMQVNYRGSAGRGETFLEAGKRQWGEGIEDDLEAAIEAVVGRGWADGERICVAGGSYGGYSALISLVRNPERYRCAASVNGPTDVPLQLHHFGFGYSDTLREILTDLIGDPREDYDRLRSISPAYRAGEIRAPVLLIHGTEDRVVDVDHYYRMKLALEGLGGPAEFFLIEGGGHAPTAPEWVQIAGRLRRFLTRHLRPAPSAVP